MSEGNPMPKEAVDLHEDAIDIQSLQPEDQLAIFTRSSLMKTFLLSAVIHILLIGGSKLSAFISPPPAEDEEAAVAAGEDAGEEEIGEPEDDGKPREGEAGEGDGSEGAEDLLAEEAEGETGEASGTGEGEDDPRIRNQEIKEGMEEVEEPATDPADLGWELDEMD